MVPKAADPVTPVSNVDLGETEMQIRYALFAHQWDLGEDLVISTATGNVTVTGTASTKERAEAMQVELGKISNATIAIIAPAAGNGTRAGDSSTLQSPASVFIPLLKETLDKFTAQDERIAFIDHCLLVSDIELSHAWALRRLADRYSDADERMLTSDSQAKAKLRQMVVAHLQQLSEANAGLDRLLELIPKGRAQDPALPVDWRAGILALFGQVQQQDSSVASMVAGTQANTLDLAATATRFRMNHRAISVFTGALSELIGGPVQR